MSAGTGGAGAGRPDDLVLIKRQPFNAETPLGSLSQSITPSPNVYVRTNLGVPALSPSAHRIRIAGAVTTSCQLSLRELHDFPRVDVITTMECAGNDRTGMRPLPPGEPWRSGALSTLEWSGVRLLDVLDRASLGPAAVEILIEGADRGVREDAPAPLTFARSLPRSEATRPDVLLALTMNGAPLTADHGGPVRLVVPGWYGMASVKWVAAITALTEPYVGYFQVQRYVYEGVDSTRPVTRMRVKSLIVSPHEEAAVPVGPLSVRGWAWSGYGTIERVELSIGGGESWRDAILGTPVSSHAWTPWHCDLVLDEPGRQTLRSRATDSAGNVQPDVIAWNRLGYGNNAVRPVTIQVSG